MVWLNTLPSISFGEDIRRPALLETRNTAVVIFGIRDGKEAQ